MRTILLLGAVVVSLCAADRPSFDEMRARRTALRKSVDGVIVLIGRTDADTDDSRDGIFQESNFFYLTHWSEPGALLLMSPGEEILFLPARDAHAERYYGRRLAAGDETAHSRTGFDTVMPASSFEAEMFRLLETKKDIYTLVKEQPQAARLKALLSFRGTPDLKDAAPAIARLRMVKSAGEIELLQHSIDVTLAAHRAAWKRLQPGLHEYQVAAAFENSFREQGCERAAYPSIIGSGPNSVILHYWQNKRRADQGEVMVMDAGAECAGYAADITRTLPVGGKFTARQRELYEIVLGSQKAAIAAVKPGMALGKEDKNSLYQIVYEYINTHGKDQRGNPLGQYVLHGLGHQVGLDVHDAVDPALPLAAGMVITIEPGLYIAEENIGIRIEDMVLVTEDGGKVLSGALPREVKDIERALER